MPNLIGGIVLGYIWQILLNCVLSLLEKPLLTLDATAGFWGLVILMCWQQIGYMMIMADLLEGEAAHAHALHHHLPLPDHHQQLQAL